MNLTRRRLLGAGSATAALGLAGCELNPRQTGTLITSGIDLPERFQVPLPVPTALKPASTADGRHVFEITQKEASVEILPGGKTDILGYDGTFPGPLLDTPAVQEIVVRHRNRTSVPTVAHLHGGHTPASSDGFPVDFVEPGDDRDYVYPLEQRGATLWYHDHTMDFTGEQVYRGLFGVHIVRDPAEETLDLPHGDREIPLAIVDRSFDEHGQFSYPARDGHGDHHGGVDDSHIAGVLGDVILVNGAPWPELEVEAARYRFRILNGCNARRLDLALSPAPSGPSFVQIGSDGGLLAEPIEHRHLVVAQAERFDVIVDFSQYEVGDEIELVNRIGGDSTAKVMRFVVARKGSDDSAPTDQLGELSSIEKLETSGTRRRLWRFEKGRGTKDWTVNDEKFDPDEMQAKVPLGEVERWRFRSDMHHPIHVHLASFQVLSRLGRDIGAYDHGWKDTVDVRPGEEVEVAVRFTEHTGKYVIHCHNLEHEDRMMMAAFETV